MDKFDTKKHIPLPNVKNENFSKFRKSTEINGSIFDSKSFNVCRNFLDDLIEVSKGDSSIKFFRKDLVSMIIWLFIIKSFYLNKSINIEDISREIAPASKISKPSLRLILENAREKGFIKFTHNSIDHRSWIIEPENVTINEFKKWSEAFI